MTEEIAVRLIRKAELRGADPYAEYDDPAGLAQMPAAKRNALLANPLSDSEDDPIQLLGVQGRLVTGRIDLLPGQVVVAGEPTRAMFASGLFVPPEYRSTGTALMLLLKMQSLWPASMVCGVSQMVYPIYGKLLRWVDFAMPRYVLLRRSRVLVERYCGRGLHSRVLSSVADLGLLAWRNVLGLLASPPRVGRELQERSGEPPPELDAAFARLPDSARCHRSAAWLKWLLENDFRDEPRNSQSWHGLFDETGRLVAYYVVKVRFHAEASQLGLKNFLLGSVADWLVLDPGRVDELAVVLAATRSLAKLGVDAVEICTPDEKLGSQLRSLGCVRAGELRLLFKANPKSPLAGKRFHELGAWRLRPCEGDHFFT
jgi:hypothetical protein